jgi:hypothetical protein
LLIWHVDATLDADGYDFAFNNQTTKHKLLRLMEADGLEEIEAGGTADAGDFYMLGASIGAGTVPSSGGYNGRPSGVEVKDIHRRRTGLAATFAVGAPK